MNRSKVLEIMEYVKGSPETINYGRWGALNSEQRRFIAYLCESWLILDGETNRQTKEIERLNKCINETLNTLKDYENDGEANRYAPIKEAIEILEGVTK